MRTKAEDSGGEPRLNKTKSMFAKLLSIKIT